jgi:glycogen debranching enzyme
MSDLPTFTEESAAIGIGSVTLTQGASFAICNLLGEIPGHGVVGLFVGDTRVCSRLAVTVDGHPVEPLAATTQSPFTATFGGRTPDRELLVRREIWVGRGMRLDVHVRNLTTKTRSTSVEVFVGTDLAELFTVKEGKVVAYLPAIVPTVGDGELVFADEDGSRGLMARASQSPQVEPDGTFRWQIDVSPGEDWSCCVELAAIRGGEEIEARYRCDESPEVALPSARQARWEDELPRLDSDVAGLEEAFTQSGHDLGALRLFDPHHPLEPVIAAGAPWYMTLFGRDSILTSWMALLLDPHLALSTARALARMQGKYDVVETEEQPGRILHEVRFAKGASLALADGEVYYGTVDATPLFVMLVHELWRWGVPLEQIRPLLPAVRAALDWLSGPGDPDGDGYVEYERKTPEGLANQGWKDSFDGISFADGRLPDAPIALAEVQAYTYAAWRAGAALARAVGDNVRAAAHEARATVLQRQFATDFWLPERQAIAMALDGDKKPVDAVSSNMGHCLWAGIVGDHYQAAAVARWLLSPELNSGWGVRTLASSMSRYNPLSYHNGSVWPHDSAICVAGLRRAGFDDAAMQLASGLLSAAAAMDGRLPELFAGLTPNEFSVPLPYPTSCSPQAWSAAAPLLLVRAMLGLEPDVPAGRIELDPVLPAGATRLQVESLSLAGADVTIEIDGDAVAVRNLPRGLALIRPPA